MIEQSRLVLVGAIAGAFGVKGEVRVRSFTAVPEDVFAYGPLLDARGAVVMEVKSFRPVPDGFAATSPQIRTREQAAALRSTPLHVERSRMPPVAEDEFYIVDLIGLTVEALDGSPLGRVRHVLAGPQDLLEIEATPGVRASWHLPFTKTLVPIVDLAGQRLVADVPDGLIPPRDEPTADEPPQTELTGTTDQPTEPTDTSPD